MIRKRQVNIGTPTRVGALHLRSIGQSACGCCRVRFSAVDTKRVSGRQMTQTYRKPFGELVAPKLKFKTLSCWLFLLL